jgi:hypothetical protein
MMEGWLMEDRAKLAQMKIDDPRREELQRMAQKIQRDLKRGFFLEDAA